MIHYSRIPFDSNGKKNTGKRRLGYIGSPASKKIKSCNIGIVNTTDDGKEISDLDLDSWYTIDKAGQYDMFIEFYDTDPSAFCTAINSAKFRGFLNNLTFTCPGSNRETVLNLLYMFHSLTKPQPIFWKSFV